MFKRHVDNSLVVAMNNSFAVWLSHSIIDPVISREEQWGFGRFMPSTGFQALALVVALANRVGAPAPSVYGYGACEPCNRYFECSQGAEVDYEAVGDNGYHPFVRPADFDS